MSKLVEHAARRDQWARRRALVTSAALTVARVFSASEAEAADERPVSSSMPSPLACPKCSTCCKPEVESGPRAGLSINGDQWLLGGHLRIAIPCFGGLGFGPTLAVGLGGNFITLRSSGRLDYMFWLDEARAFGIYPSAGASALFYGPVGGFATFCKEVHLDECWGHNIGLEVGGGLRYRWLGADAFMGFNGLPVVTIMLAAWFPLTHPEDE